ncbi:hypothetical protein GCM10009559_51730 [Pseudonocardia zijingensis]|uniref:Uncharacterized protein n=1 Tax=Pseudonocardia zijingensis TaxID=153376 RepID=A0ABN1N726_9PSEU
MVEAALHLNDRYRGPEVYESNQGVSPTRRPLAAVGIGAHLSHLLEASVAVRHRLDTSRDYPRSMPSAQRHGRSFPDVRRGWGETAEGP